MVVDAGVDGVQEGIDQVLQDPTDEYTRRLLADTPSLETATA